MDKKPKIIVILGQTSTGKSDFAVEVAKKIGGEVISADSRQVYKGMNLGTGKITKKEMKGVPHHLLDVVNPKKVFSVSEYQKLTKKKIEEIVKRGKIPVLCGGTGFYIDAVIYGMEFPTVEPNEELRRKLSKYSDEKLKAYLYKLDPNRSKSIDSKNRVRVIRAIEIAGALGKVPDIKKEELYNTVKIGLTLPDEILKDKIKMRLLARIQKGMMREIKNLHENGLSFKRMEMLGLEYRYGALYLQKKITKKEMIDRLVTETWQYAKRQKTWFKRDKDIIWIDPRKKSEKASVIKSLF